MTTQAKTTYQVFGDRGLFGYSLIQEWQGEKVTIPCPRRFRQRHFAESCARLAAIKLARRG